MKRSILIGNEIYSITLHLSYYVFRFNHKGMTGKTILSPSISYKRLDRAPLRFAPWSTVLPAWLAPLAAKGSVASLPHNELVTPGHIWSLLVTDGYKYIMDGIVSVPWLVL